MRIWTALLLLQCLQGWWILKHCNLTRSTMGQNLASWGLWRVFEAEKSWIVFLSGSPKNVYFMWFNTCLDHSFFICPNLTCYFFHVQIPHCGMIFSPNKNVFFRAVCTNSQNVPGFHVHVRYFPRENSRGICIVHESEIRAIADGVVSQF